MNDDEKKLRAEFVDGYSDRIGERLSGLLNGALAAAREEGRRAGLVDARELAEVLARDIGYRVTPGDDRDAMLGALDTLRGFLDAKFAVSDPRDKVETSDERLERITEERESALEAEGAKVFR